MWSRLAIDEDDERLIQLKIPEMNTNLIDPRIDGRGRINTWAVCNTPFDYRVSLFEHKTLDNVKVSVEARPNL